eukprot:TRINITY_DN81616_c0_g1_i1.p1 TRINITY_DN81616_c0_g1~~TRINITY_DN81616_c0_g1_i1.p1  ORF type:complete len:108 (-),score=11.90 TRINITY_DN81616_c0_g1_i1:30-353(-)
MRSCVAFLFSFSSNIFVSPSTTSPLFFSQKTIQEEMSALFNFDSLVVVILLFICGSTYIHILWPSLLDGNKSGFLGVFYKASVIGERLSPWVSVLCAFMGIVVLFFR